jgi:Domain of unknown function (DUF6379)
MGWQAPLSVMARSATLHWDFGTPLTVTVMASGGLKPGIHDVAITLGMNPSYVPVGLFLATGNKRMTLVA